MGALALPAARRLRIHHEPAALLVPSGLWCQESLPHQQTDLLSLSKRPLYWDWFPQRAAGVQSSQYRESRGGSVTRQFPPDLCIRCLLKVLIFLGQRHFRRKTVISKDIATCCARNADAVLERGGPAGGRGCSAAAGASCRAEHPPGRLLGLPAPLHEMAVPPCSSERLRCLLTSG